MSNHYDFCRPSKKSCATYFQQYFLTELNPSLFRRFVKRVKNKNIIIRWMFFLSMIYISLSVYLPIYNLRTALYMELVVLPEAYGLLAFMISGFQTNQFPSLRPSAIMLSTLARTVFPQAGCIQNYNLYSLLLLRRRVRGSCMWVVTGVYSAYLVGGITKQRLGNIFIHRFVLQTLKAIWI